MPDLRISTPTGSNMTLLWPPDDTDAELLQAALDGAGVSWERVRHETMTGEVALGVPLGMPSIDALDAAADAGFRFRWHEEQEPRHRVSDLYGFSIDRV